MTIDATVMARVDAKTEIRGTDECWPWLGSRTKKGTPNMYFFTREDGTQRAGSPRRLVWERATGEAPDRKRIIKFSCGNLLCMNPKHMIVPTVEEKFWAQVKKLPGDGCWLFQGALHRGYGQFFPVQGDHRIAHRYAWEITNGPIPEGMYACHHCDNPTCVRPSHLFIGTPAENTADMLSKGRAAHQKNPERVREKAKNARARALPLCCATQDEKGKER